MAESNTATLPHLDYSTYCSQAFWLMLSFALLYLAVSRVILPKIRDTLEKRDRKTKGSVIEAERLNAMSKKLDEEYNSKIKETQEIAMVSVGYIEDSVKNDFDSLRAKLKEDLNLHLLDIKHSLEASRSQWIEESRSSIFDFAKLYYKFIFGENSGIELEECVNNVLKNNAD